MQISIQEQEQSNPQFVTPAKQASTVVHTESKPTNTLTNKEEKTRHRVPIFKHPPKQQSQPYFCINNQNYDHGQQSEINFDFCGCESSVNVCQIIQDGFLKGVSMNAMKQQYDEIVESTNMEGSTAISVRRHNLFKMLPKIYPQTYLTQLSNLLMVIGPGITGPEFECLAWLEYHCKIEYVTYFLFEDLKRTYNGANKGKFMVHLNKEFERKDPKFTNLQALRGELTENGNEGFFDNFIDQYYDSVGANLIPLTYYARFIKLVYQRGVSVLVRFLVNFIQNEKRELKGGLKLLSYGEKEKYRMYIRGLNWEAYFDEMI